MQMVKGKDAQHWPLHAWHDLKKIKKRATMPEEMEVYREKELHKVKKKRKEMGTPRK